MSFSSQNIKNKKKSSKGEDFVKIVKFWFKKTLPLSKNFLEPINPNQMVIFTQPRERRKRDLKTTNPNPM